MVNDVNAGGGIIMTLMMMMMMYSIQIRCWMASSSLVALIASASSPRSSII